MANKDAEPSLTPVEPAEVVQAVGHVAAEAVGAVDTAADRSQSILDYVKDRLRHEGFVVVDTAEPPKDPAHPKTGKLTGQTNQQITDARSFAHNKRVTAARRRRLGLS